MNTTYLIQPRDPILARDGRPFAAEPGAIAQSLPWPLPSTTTGAIRTYLGGDWSTNPEATASRMLQVAVHGPLLVAKRDQGPWQVYYPAPADAVVYEMDAPVASENDEPGEKPKTKPKKIMNLLPRRSLPPGAGCDLPSGLSPLSVTEDVKPSPDSFAFWSHDFTCSRLATACPSDAPPKEGIRDLMRESRVHVKIDPKTKTGEEGKLFATTSLVFPDGLTYAEGKPGGKKEAIRLELGMICRVQGASNGITRNLQCLAGEKRLAYLTPNDALWPEIPETLKSACKGSQRIKLQLVTPAYFPSGWKPDWLDDSLSGSPPCLPGVTCRLVSAAISRRVAVSGWDFKTKKPKASRFLVPAGSVYFFEVQGNTLDEFKVNALWLASLCTSEQDRLDGFGLVIPGIWDYANKEDTSG